MNRWDTFWDTARVKRLTELWLAGWSAGQIGKLFGTTRSSVIGKVHRMGLHHQKRAEEAPPEGRIVALPKGPRAPRLTRPPSPPAGIAARQFSRPRAMLNPFGAGGVAGVKARAKREALPAMPVLLLVGEYVTLDGLKPQHCRWPVSSCLPGRGETLLFCGAPKDPEHRSYCPFHREAAIDRSKSNSASKLARSLRRYTEPYVRRAS